MPGAAPGHVHLAGTGNSEALALEQIEIDALQGHIVGRGDLHWRPEVGAAIELTGDALDPGVLASEWPGRLGVTVRAEATVDGPDVRVQIDRLKVDGELRGRPIELAAQGQYSTDTIRLESLSLRAGATRIDASGRPPKRLRCDGASRARISPSCTRASRERSRRAASSTVRACSRGSPSTPPARPLRYLDSEVGELELTGDVDLAGQAPSQMRPFNARRQSAREPHRAARAHGRGQRRASCACARGDERPRRSTDRIGRAAREPLAKELRLDLRARHGDVRSRRLRGVAVA